MKQVDIDLSNAFSFVDEDEINRYLKENINILQSVRDGETLDSNVLGWLDVVSCADEGLIRKIEDKAIEIRDKADVFLLIGIGGSNQGARAVIEALTDNLWFDRKTKKGTRVLYAGNNLSPAYLKKILYSLEGKSVYANIIAKNFATLEPGITFRIIREYMEKAYGVEEAGSRIIATGSLNGSSLEELGRMKGYTLLPFPLDVGGRFSVLSAVGLLPIAVAGIDIRSLLNGATEMEKLVKSEEFITNPAVKYGALRNILLKKGYKIEILSSFDPRLDYFSKWWVQLFGESEGKNGKGIYPTTCSFSEDLHSLGQYIQQGQRFLFETFLHIEDQGEHLIVPRDNDDIDRFSYLDNKDFAFLNDMAYEATVKAHTDGGVPCIVLNVPELSPYYFGQLFYFFMYSCFISGTLLGVNPFDQPGVEFYKVNMFSLLGRDK